MTGFVYAVAAGDRVKIGFSKNPRKRLAKIKTDCCLPCRLLGVRPGSLEDESAMHSQYRAFHLFGDWFDASGLTDLLVTFYPPAPTRRQVRGNHPLRSYRTRKTVSMEDMAERLGVAVPQLSRIETGIRGVSPAMALKIHDVTQGEVAKWELRPDLWVAEQALSA